MAGLPTSLARTGDAIPRTFSSGSKFRNGDTLVARITPCLENGKMGFVNSIEERQVARRDADMNIALLNIASQLR